LQQSQGAAHVVVKVAYGLGHGFAHGFEAGEVDDPLNLVLGKDLVERGAVAHIGLNEAEVFPCQRFKPVEHLDAAVAQVVHDDHVVACVHEFDRGVRADVACATGDEDLGCHVLIL
jgi:hypothetical protein